MAKGKPWSTELVEKIMPVMVWVTLKPSEIVAVDKLIEVFGSDGRPAMIRKILNHFLELDNDEQRKVLVAEELHRKKAAALLAKQKAEKELEQLEADIKRIGCKE
jgi:hypothetical protein